jgi:hypothetical protein
LYSSTATTRHFSRPSPIADRKPFEDSSITESKHHGIHIAGSKHYRIDTLSGAAQATYASSVQKEETAYGQRIWISIRSPTTYADHIDAQWLAADFVAKIIMSDEIDCNI